MFINDEQYSSFVVDKMLSKSKHGSIALYVDIGTIGYFKDLKVTPLQNPVNDMVKDWERAKAYTKEYLDVMPEKGYSLKPTKEMRSFAEQLLHLTDANYGFAAAATGGISPVLASIAAVYLDPNQPYPTNTNLRPAENKTSAKMAMMGLLENLMVPR